MYAYEAPNGSTVIRDRLTGKVIAIYMYGLDNSHLGILAENEPF